MKTYKITWTSLLASAVAIVSITLTPSVYAQISIGDVFNNSINGVPKHKHAATEPTANGQLPSGLQPSAAPPKSVEPVLWASKADFLTATRNGDLIAIDRIAGPLMAEFRPVASSIAAILQADYGVALPYSDSDIRKANGCAMGFVADVANVLGSVAKLHSQTLSQQPPDYFKDPSQESINHVELFVKRLQVPGGGSDNHGSCDLQFLGVRKPQPYKAALLKLMDEYGQATKDYVEAERSRRKTAYAGEQAQKLAQQKERDEAQAKQEADARAAEQQRIDAERARIQNEQKKREQQEQNRVGG